jgi:trypsin
MKFKVVRFVLLLVLFVENAVLKEIGEELPVEDESDGSTRIVGGQIMQIESASYIVSIFYKLRHLCGGSIISKKWIASAAHCVIDRDAKNYKVRSGSSRKSRGGTMTDAAEVIPHPEYDSKTLNYDYMLIKLATKLEFTQRQQPIKLAEENSKAYFEDEEVLTSGFGQTQNEMQSSEFLRGVVVKFTGRTACKKAYPDLITDYMVCAGSKSNQDSCQGDSGGPLESIKTGELVGIVSFGMACADPSYPGVYSNVAKVRPWYKQVAGV